MKSLIKSLKIVTLASFIWYLYYKNIDYVCKKTSHDNWRSSGPGKKHNAKLSKLPAGGL